MRPYLAVIRDSFAEAFASRVLWVVLIAITLVLLAIAPAGYEEERTIEFNRRDLLDARQLARRLEKEYRQHKPSPGRRIWAKLPSETRRELAAFGSADEEHRSNFDRGVNKLVDALNGLLPQRDLYRPEDWKGVLLTSEARALIEQGTNKLAKEDLARLNRLLIEKPFADRFRPQPARQVHITYLGFLRSRALSISANQVKKLIEKTIIPVIMSVLVGMIALFVAILVTASIIPRMFDPGSLHLLLSKPVSRSLLFLAKFVGGCAFILINETYLITGLWLIAGTRFGIWNHRLLLCIPLFLFLFALYYVVSAFAGVIWRNAVVSVVMTVLFWFAWTTVSATKTLVEKFAIERQKIVHLLPAGGTLFAVSEQGATSRWDPKTRRWEPCFIQRPRGPMAAVLGPVYDEKQAVLFAAQSWRRGFFGSGAKLLIGKKSEGWAKEDGPTLPAGTFALLPDPKGRFLVVTSSGIERPIGGFDKQHKKMELFGIEIPTTFGKPFRSVGPQPPLALSSNMVAAVDHQSGDIVIYSRGTLIQLRRQGDRYAVQNSVEVDADEEEGGAVGIGGSTVMLALADGRLLIHDKGSLRLRRTLRPEKHSQPRFIETSLDGRWFAVVFHNEALYLLDNQQRDSQLTLAKVRGQGDISAVAFALPNRMLVVDRNTRVTRYELESWKTIRSDAPDLSLMERAYYYVIMPLYTVFPKPGELGNTMMYILRGEETISMAGMGNDLQSRRERVHPWAPVWNGLAFMLVMLGLACFYIERQDF